MQKVVAYLVAGGILLAVADVAPKVAIATTGLILFSAVMSHSNQLTTLGNWISTATGTKKATGV